MNARADAWIVKQFANAVEVATDGSGAGRSSGGSAYYTSSGDWKIESVNSTESSTEQEIRAIRLALENLTGDIIVMSDSESALQMLYRAAKATRGLKFGSVEQLKIYFRTLPKRKRPSKNVLALNDLAAEVHFLRMQRRGNFALIYVKGHSGNYYNEAAHELCNIARLAEHYDFPENVTYDLCNRMLTKVEEAFSV